MTKLFIIFQAKQQATDIQDSVSKILQVDSHLEQDHMEGVEDKEWVNPSSFWLRPVFWTDDFATRTNRIVSDWNYVDLENVLA